MTSTASTDPLQVVDSPEDVMGKTAVLVDARNQWPSPSTTFFKITEAMPERMRQSLKKNLLRDRNHKKHSYMIVTCRHVDQDDHDRTVLFDDGANTCDELIEAGEMEDEDCVKAQQFFSKLLESPPGDSCVVEAGDEPPTFVFGLY